MAACPVSLGAAPAWQPRCWRPTVRPAYVIVRNGANIATLADLKGKKLAVSRGTILELSLSTLLGRAGLTQKDVQLFDLKSADQVTALSTGDIDAIVGLADLLALPERGLGKIIYSTKAKGHVDPANAFGSFVVTEAFAKKYPATTQRVVNAFVKAAHFASQEANRDELIRIWELTGTPRQALVNDYKDDVLGDRLSPLLDDFYVGNVQRGIAFAREQKLVRRTIDLGQWVRFELYKQGHQGLGLREGSGRPGTPMADRKSEGPAALETQADVLVLGGGPAGAWAALMAARAGSRVVLADKGYFGTSGATAPSNTGTGACRPVRSGTQRWSGALRKRPVWPTQIARNGCSPKPTTACSIWPGGLSVSARRGGGTVSCQPARSGLHAVHAARSESRRRRGARSLPRA